VNELVGRLVAHVPWRGRTMHLYDLAAIYRRGLQTAPRDGLVVTLPR
jgi:hypothetical protein